MTGGFLDESETFSLFADLKEFSRLLFLLQKSFYLFSKNSTSLCLYCLIPASCPACSAIFINTVQYVSHFVKNRLWYIEKIFSGKFSGRGQLKPLTQRSSVTFPKGAWNTAKGMAKRRPFFPLAGISRQRDLCQEEGRTPCPGVRVVTCAGLADSSGPGNCGCAIPRTWKDLPSCAGGSD